jgi:hypothetical protein
MYAYIDETGNTGQNIFDEAQPHFLTAALVTRTNFDVLYRVPIHKLANSVGVTALHANELGLRQIETISPDLLRILKKADARFIFSNIEKKYLSLTKIVDYVFDCGENLAVPWQVYSLRTLRLLITFKLAYIIDHALAKDFWTALMEPQRDQAYAKYVAACRELLSRVDYLPDKRSREVVSQALRWVIDNPETIRFHSSTREGRYDHFPNMVAFINLIAGIENQSKRWNRPVKLIVHDEQMQFAKNLKRWHAIFTNASDEPFRWPGDAPVVLRRVPGSTFFMSRDNDSPGIQVTDILLWLFKRIVEEKHLGPDSGSLLHFALSRAWYQDFSFKNVGRELQERLEMVNNADISEDRIQKAFEMIESEKLRRQRAIIEYVENKLISND